jgi:hypothetical protein
VEFVEEIGGEVREEEGEVIVVATEEVAISERLEEALFRILGYVAEIWEKGDENEVADKFLQAISGLVDIFGVSQDDVRKKLMGILDEIERGTSVPPEVVKWIPDTKEFVQELKALLSPTSQQIEPLAPPPTGPEEEDVEEVEEPVEPEEGAVPVEGGALQEDEVGRDDQSGTEEEDRGRFLLAKFYFLAKALRVFP